MKAKVLSALMSLIIVSTCVLPVYAKGNEVRDQLDPRHQYVYDLVQDMSNSKYSMLKVVQSNDNYFQIMDINGILDILSGEHRIEALLGSDSYTQAYLNTVIANTITTRNVDYKEDEIKDAERFMDVIDTEAELLENVPGYLSEVTGAAKSLSTAWDGEVYLLKVAYASDLYLNALDLVAEDCNDENIVFSAKKASVYARSDEAKGQFLYWADTISKKGVNELLDTLTASSPLIIWNFAELGFDIIAGDTAENNLSELHATAFQSAVYNTFFNKLYSKGSNYLQNDYSDEELKDLHSLAALYLQAGNVGFAFNQWKNSKDCRKELKHVLDMVFPDSGNSYEGPDISIADYSVPGQLSEGDKYCFFGLVRSSDLLDKVSINIVSDHNNYQYDSPELKTDHYSISDLDNEITVNQLPADNYHYIVSATTQSGTYVVLDAPFKIIEEDGNMTISQYRIPGVIKEGACYPVTGIVKSKSLLKEVKVEIIAMDGTRITGDGESNVNNTQYDLSRLDAGTRFDILTPGQYRYRVISSNESGTEVLVDQPMIVEVR